MRGALSELSLRLLISLAPLYLWCLLVLSALREVQLGSSLGAAVLLSLAARLSYVLLDSMRRRRLSDAFLLCTIEVLLGVALMAPSMLGLRPVLGSLGTDLFLAWFGAALLLMPLADIFSLYFVPPFLSPALLLPRFGVQLFYLTGLVAFMRGIRGPVALDALLPSLFTAGNGLTRPSFPAQGDPLYLAFGTVSLLCLYAYCLRPEGGHGPRPQALILSLPSALLALLLSALAADAPLGASGSLFLVAAALSLISWLAWHE